MSDINMDAPPGEPNTGLNWALAYAEAGLFILEIAEGAKEPVSGKGWLRHATNNSDVIKQMFARNPNMNWGACPGPHFIWLDLDIGERKDGLEELSRLEFENDEMIPESFRCRSASGGLHILLRTPRPCTNANDFPHGIDVRGGHGYVVGPGSTLIEGKCKETDTAGTYTHEAGSLDEIADVPGWVLELLRSPGNEDPNHDVPLCEWDLAINIELAKEFLAEREPAIMGESGDAWTVNTAAFLRDIGISEALALRLMVATGWNERCQPRWDLEELELKIKNGYRYSENRPGCKAAFPTRVAEIRGGSADTPGQTVKGDGGEIPEDDQNKETPEPLHVESFAEMLGREPEPVVDLLDGFIEKGIVNFLVGPGFSGKSRLAIQLGLCIHVGRQVFGRETVRSDLVYVSAEDDRNEVTRRVHEIAKGLEIDRSMIESALHLNRCRMSNALAIMSGDGYRLTSFFHQLCDQLDHMSGHKLVILDSAYDFVRFPNGSKIDEDAVNTFVKEILEGICEKTDSTLLIPWHPSRAGMERGDGSGWSVAWDNAPRLKSLLTRDKKSDVLTWSVPGRNHGPAPSELKLVFENGIFRPLTLGNDTEVSERFRKHCIEFAIAEAEANQPITVQKNLTTPQLEAMGERLGYTVDSRKVKDELQRARQKNLLEYVNGSGNKAAGYYPVGGGEAMAYKVGRERRAAKKS